MDFEAYPDTEMLVIDLANQLAGDLTAALDHVERALFVVPGGTTPGPIFDDLCAADLDWSRVDVMLSDERWVPEDHPRSNTRLLRERLLVNRAAKARLVPLYGGTPSPEDALAGLAEEIRHRLPIDVLLLGMGADMHTASLFPGADRLAEALAPDAPILVPMRAPGAAEPRITLSAPTLDGALVKHLVILGDDKRQALQRARELPAIEAPVTAVTRGMKVHWAA